MVINVVPLPLRPRQVPSLLRTLMLALSIPLLQACTPVLDWREVALEGGRLQALFPCKPSSQERPVPRESGPSASAWLQVCRAQGLTFAVLTLPVPVQADGQPDDQALDRLIEGATLRWGERAEPAAEPIAGVRLPTGVQAHWRLCKRQEAEGQAVLTHALFMRHEDRIVQFSVSGPRLDTAVLESFFGGIRVPA